MNRCPECGSFQIDERSAGLMCRNCGLIIDDAPLDRNGFIPESMKNNASLPGCETLSTMPVDGNIVKHEWLLTTQEKNIFKAKRKLELIASKHNLPKTAEDDAFMLFRRVVDAGLNIGRSNTEILYACVYASCIMHSIPKTALELTAFTGIDKTKMLSAFKQIKRELNLNLPQIDPVDFVQRFGSRLGLKQTTMSLASQIIVKLKKTAVMAGKQPKTIVASAIYIASKMNNDNRTQREVANATGVLEVTIRKRSREMAELLF